jgi:hypothetical protein
MKKYVQFFFCFLLLLIGTTQAKAYSVLTHLAVIDGAWQDALVPLIKTKYPDITAHGLHEAHAYAYGGAIIQDMGYYPMGSTFFTDLTHYVNTGQFVENLLANSKTSNEYAFALGALSHYYSDLHGHPEGTNLSVPAIYPKIEKQLGRSVAYEQDPVAHTRVEFAFDVLQAARREYAPEAYRDYIGFKLARPLLEKAFQETYGLKLRNIFVYLPLAEFMFRLSVKALIPEFTKIAWHQNKKEIEKADKQAIDVKELDGLHSQAFEQKFSNNESPGASARILSFVIRVLPKVGPLSPLKFKVPTPEAESLFIKSFDTSLKDYEKTLLRLQNEQLVRLKTSNLDTGTPIFFKDYILADETHRILLDKLESEDFHRANTTLKNYLLEYYAVLPPPPDYRKEKKQWRKTKASLEMLQQIP